MLVISSCLSSFSTVSESTLQSLLHISFSVSRSLDLDIAVIIYPIPASLPLFTFDEAVLHGYLLKFEIMVPELNMVVYF